MTPKTHSNLKQLLQEFQRTGREFHACVRHHTPHHPGARRFESHLRKAVRGAAAALQDARPREDDSQLFVVRISWLPSESERTSAADESSPAQGPAPTHPDAASGFPAHAEREAAGCVDEQASSEETLSSEEERCWRLYERLQTGVEDAVHASGTAQPADDGWPTVEAFTPPFGKL